MNIKRLCLIAGLLALPVAHANAAEIIINVPVELTNVPVANTRASVTCQAGVGAPSTVPRELWTGHSAIGEGYAEVAIPASRNYRGTVRLVMMAAAGKSLDAATHYKCFLIGTVGQPPLTSQNAVSGTIPRR